MTARFLQSSRLSAMTHFLRDSSRRLVCQVTQVQLKGQETVKNSAGARFLSGGNIVPEDVVFRLSTSVALVEPV
jgi:hypothetical protein